MEDELKAISHTPSAYLLMHIGNAFRLVTYLASEHQASRNYYSHVDYDRQINSHSVVQEIEELKVKLDVTEDDDERRTLEEDVTGKILWLCWCGICSEVDELLPKVLNCIQNEGNVKALLNIHALMYSTLRWTVPDDDQAHLRRIMFDAGAGISKHQLFVSA
ncbi:hypothetical protein EDC04DRAFT_1840593 [Pisolithus marmoratus]|nr:hypothetical protein EDC04DRAFT_1840593 [Pisolithus marmoratus]